MTREHWKTIGLAALTAVLVVVDIQPLRTISVHVEMPPAGEPAAGRITTTHAETSIALATGLLALVVLIVTIVLIVWLVRRCLRHVADARRPNPADVF